MLFDKFDWNRHNKHNAMIPNSIQDYQQGPNSI